MCGPWQSLTWSISCIWHISLLSPHLFMVCFLLPCPNKTKNQFEDCRFIKFGWVTWCYTCFGHHQSNAKWMWLSCHAFCYINQWIYFDGLIAMSQHWQGIMKPSFVYKAEIQWSLVYKGKKRIQIEITIIIALSLKKMLQRKPELESCVHWHPLPMLWCLLAFVPMTYSAWALIKPMPCQLVPMHSWHSNKVPTVWCNFWVTLIMEDTREPSLCRLCIWIIVLSYKTDTFMCHVISFVYPHWSYTNLTLMDNIMGDVKAIIENTNADGKGGAPCGHSMHNWLLIHQGGSMFWWVPMRM